jgi:SAM-dependent methyltransferase
MDETKDSNVKTIHSYEQAVDAYVAKTAPEVVGIVKNWLDAALALLTKESKIFEIGSGFGRDAKYIESKGFSLERSDATKSFRDLLSSQGYEVRSFNVLQDPFPSKYDLILAGAVFLHFTREECLKALAKVHEALLPHGVFAFSLRVGEGESWESEKLGLPRYFCYWTEESLKPLLQKIGFSIETTFQDERWLCLVLRKKLHG